MTQTRSAKNINFKVIIAKVKCQNFANRSSRIKYRSNPKKLANDVDLHFQLSATARRSKVKSAK